MVLPTARSRPFALLLSAGLAAGSACSVPAAAQERPDSAESSLVLHATVHRVIVDVVVVDDKGQPVKGLSQKDFAVAEDGKAQRILSFEEHDMDADPDAEARPPEATALPVNTFVNLPTAPERGPLNVILYDMLDTSMDDQPYARLQMLKFVDEMPEGSRFAIFVLADGLHLAQGFTSDRDQLHSILDARNRSHIPKIFLYADNYRESVSPLGALSDIARFLDGMPGRKNLIWLSSHFPVPFLPNLAHAREERQDNDERIRRVTNGMAAGQIALYPIDVRGVAIGNLNGDNHVLNGEYLAEDGMAEATGGRAFHSTNDLRSAIAEASEAGSRYYTMSYAPTNEKWDGGLRRIHIQTRVEAAHPGYRLEYRRSYFAFDEPQKPDRVAPDPAIESLSNKLQHGAPMSHELFLEVHVHAAAAPNGGAAMSQTAKGREKRGGRKTAAQTLAIDYRVDLEDKRPLDSAGRAPDGGAAPDLEFVAMAYDSAGRILNAIVQKSLHEGNSGAESGWPPGWFRVRQTIDVPREAVWIRVAARDLATNRVGSLEVALPLEPEPAEEPAAAAMAKRP